MYQFDNVMRAYAESGLRTLEDWSTLHRDITTGVKPRLETRLNGKPVPLYSRDQTHPHLSVRRQPKD